MVTFTIFVRINNKQNTHNTMTTQMIKEYAKKTGKRFEEHFHSYYNEDFFRWGNSNYTFSVEQFYTIGIEMNDGIWYWWYSYDTKGWEDDCLMFKQRYSCRTGQCVRGGVGWDAEWKMMKKLGMRE